MESSGVSPHVLEHLDWVRDLARSLVRDASRADDLSQEAWLAARGASLPAGVSLRRWLAAVVRNLAFESGRGEARRRDREALSPVPESGQHATAVDLVIERAAVQRRVVEHVMELEDPYRTAILLRYFDGSKPHEIARHLGVPTATVKTRLRRAHELLRERLGRDEPDGAWLGGLLLLATARTENAALTASGMFGTGGIALSTKIAVASVASACVLAGWWALSNPPPVAPPAAVMGAPEVAAPTASKPTALDAAPIARSEHREPAAGSQGPDAVDAAPVAPAAVADVRRLEVTALDVEGVPVPSIEICFVSDGHDDVCGVADGAGVLSIAHPGRCGSVVARSDVYVTLLESHAHATGPNEALVVVVAPSCDFAGEVVDERGAPVPFAALQFGMYANFRGDFARPLDGAEFGDWTTETDAAGQFSLRAPCLDASFLRVRRAGFADQDVDLEGRSPGSRMRIVMQRPESTAGILLGRVVDLHGTPVAGARVAVEGMGTSTNERGEFQFEVDVRRAPPDDVHHQFVDAARFGPEHSSRGERPDEVLTALAPGFLPARLARDFAAHPDDGWPDLAVLVLEGAPLAIRGRVVDARGVPVPNAKVGLADRTPFGVVVENRVDAALGTLRFVEDLLGGAGESEAIADADGRFELRGLEPRAYRLWVVGPTLASLVSEPIAAGTDGVELELPKTRSIAVRGRVVRPGGEPMAGVRLTPMRELGLVPGHPDMHGQPVYSPTSVETGADGRFAFDALAADGAGLLVWAGPDYTTPPCSLAGYEPGDELEIVVAAMCQFYVELAEGVDGDEFWLEDAQGHRIDLMHRAGEFRYAVSEVQLFGRRSDVYAVDETARMFVMLAGGREVLRVPIELDAGAVTPLRF